MKISWFESQGALPALAFLGEIRGGWGKNGQRWSQTVKISWFESQGALPALAFLGKIRVLGWFVN